jgi:uncharacterized damage-inducible protein DinB
MLFAYSAWATNALLNAIARMPPDQLRQDMKSSHGSIYGTLTHMVAAEKMWLSRWRGNPEPKLMTEDDVPALADLHALWERVGREIAAFLGTMNDRKLQEPLKVTTTKGDQVLHTYGQTFLHVVDHSTYHRGQVITLMRQLGVTPPSTGMIRFFRQTGQ